MAFNDGGYSWSSLIPKFTHLAGSPFNASCVTKINEKWIQRREIKGIDCVYLKLYFQGLRKRSEYIDFSSFGTIQMVRSLKRYTV